MPRDAPKQAVLNTANESLKNQMQEVQQQQGNNWFKWLTNLPTSLPGYR